MLICFIIPTQANKVYRIFLAAALALKTKNVADAMPATFRSLLYPERESANGHTRSETSQNKIVRRIIQHILLAPFSNNGIIITPQKRLVNLFSLATEKHISSEIINVP